MQRLTKAAMATGAAAVLLVGGAGTMAYWTGTATDANIAALTSGSFTVTAGSCGPWQYLTPNKGTVVNVTAGIVPGDTVTTSCTYTLTSTGDHIALGGATLNMGSGFAGTTPTPDGTTSANNTNLAGSLLVGTVTGIGIGSPTSLTPTNSDGTITPPLDVTNPATVYVQVSVTYPYGTAAELSDGSTQNASATLSGISITLQQGNDAYGYPQS